MRAHAESMSSRYQGCIHPQGLPLLLHAVVGGFLFYITQGKCCTAHLESWTHTTHTQINWLQTCILCTPSAAVESTQAAVDARA